MRGTQTATAAGMRHLLLQFTTTNVIQSMICIIGGLCCLIPLCFEPLREYDGPYTRVSLTSARYRDLAVAAIALTIPIFLEIITETIASVRSAFSLDKDEIKVQQALINTIERSMLAGAVLTTSTIALMSANSENYINTYICASKCRMTFVGGAIATSLCRFDSNYWSVRSTYFMLCLLVTSNIMGSFADNMVRANSTIDYVASVLFMSSYAIFSYCNIMWLYSFGPTFYREVTSQALSDNSSRRSCSALSYQHLYVVIVAVVSLAIVITRKLYPELESLNSSAVFHHNMSFNTYLVLLLYISERMMKYEILQGLSALIQSKKTYIRYISHELRTPLNAAFLGLRLVCGNLEDKTDIENRENCEILDNVRTSCEAAVEILNDLLCFDKIESGILDLHKLEIHVIPFISDCVKMFSSQAREAGINISFITSHANAFQLARNVSHGALPSTSSSPVMSGINVREEQHVQDQEHPYGSILDSDRVFVDKFKMNQVMRNLISNALKFTPSGGSVVVSAFFLPDERTDGRTLAQRLTSSRTPSNCIPSSHGQRKSILSKRSLASQYHRQPRRNRLRNSSVSVHPGTEEKDDDDDDDDDVDVAIISSSLQEGSTHACSNSNVESNTFYQVATGQRESIGGNGRGDKTIYSRSLNKVARRSHNKTKIENPDDNENFVLGKLKIVVEDTGCGISDVDRARLFKEIVQFTPEILQAGGGSGLGLYISSHIIQMHSGTIQAISEGVGKGSTFVVELDMRRMRPAYRSI